VTAYKFLAADGTGVFSGFPWPLPGAGPGSWVEAPASPCRSGVHACRTSDLPYWLAPALYEVELAGDVVEQETLRMTVLEVEGTRIERLQVEFLPEAEEEPPDQVAAEG